MSKTDSAPLAKPCKRCGATDRLSNGRCRCCAKARRAEWGERNAELERLRLATWRENNKARMKEAHSEWVKANKQKRREKMREWRQANKDRLSALTSLWGKANRDLKRVHKQTRRAREINVAAELSSDLVDRLRKLQRGKCPCCSQPLGKSPHLDHVVPLALGGTSNDTNMQLLRAVCNMQKHAKHPIDFMQERGFLL